MATGWINLGGTWYYLNPGNGDMKIGWYQVNGAWYYSNGSGAMAAGWLNRGGNLVLSDGKRSDGKPVGSIWEEPGIT